MAKVEARGEEYAKRMAQAISFNIGLEPGRGAEGVPEHGAGTRILKRLTDCVSAGFSHTSAMCVAT